MKVRVCVQCGSPGREDRFSCDECGGTIVEAEPPPPVVAPTPPLSGSGNWAPPGYAPPPPGAAPVALEHPLRRHIRLRNNRALVGATIMGLVLIAGVVVLAAVATGIAGKKPTPVSKDMRAYAAGAGTAPYTTKTFAVMLPAGYHTNALTLRLSQGKSLQAVVASASNSVTAVAVASAPIDAKTASSIGDDAQQMATQLTDQMNVGGADYSVQALTVDGYPAWDITGKAAIGPSASVRVIVYPKEVVLFAAVGATKTAGDLKALEATYQRASV